MAAVLAPEGGEKSRTRLSPSSASTGAGVSEGHHWSSAAGTRGQSLWG